MPPKKSTKKAMKGKGIFDDITNGIHTGLDIAGHVASTATQFLPLLEAFGDHINRIHHHIGLKPIDKHEMAEHLLHVHPTYALNLAGHIHHIEHHMKIAHYLPGVDYGSGIISTALGLLGLSDEMGGSIRMGGSHHIKGRSDEMAGSYQIAGADAMGGSTMIAGSQKQKQRKLTAKDLK